MLLIDQKQPAAIRPYPACIRQFMVRDPYFFKRRWTFKPSLFIAGPYNWCNPAGVQGCNCAGIHALSGG
jgi:hypothetical protein